jgi:hypothetical protein
MENEYFIEIYPGEKLSNVIQPIKDTLIEHLGSTVVDDTTKTRFLRDPPHFTMQVARAKDFEAMIAAYRSVAQQFSPFTYRINGGGAALKGGLTEVHAIVFPDDVAYFRDIHLALIEASRPHLSERIPAMVSRDGLSGHTLENLERYHFPPSRDNYKPHASVGRFSTEVLEMPGMASILQGFKPEGMYHAEILKVWSYIPSDPNFNVHNPIEIPLGK